MARFGDDDDNYKTMLRWMKFRIDAAKKQQFDWFEFNEDFIPNKFTPFIDRYGEKKGLVAGHLAWRIAEDYGYPAKVAYGVRESAQNYIRMLGKYISDYDNWVKLTRIMGIKNTRSKPVDKAVLPEVVNVQQQAESLKELKCWENMSPTSENVLKYAQKLFYFSMDNPYDSDISAVPLLQMIEKNADFIGINNEQTAMFDMKTKNNNINKSLVKDVVKLYAEIGEEAWGTDCLNTDLMGSMSDMVATIIKKYDYSHKDLMELKYAAYSSQGSFARQWGPEVAKHCKSPRPARKRTPHQNHWEL